MSDLTLDEAPAEDMAGNDDSEIEPDASWDALDGFLNGADDTLAVKDIEEGAETPPVDDATAPNVPASATGDELARLQSAQQALEILTKNPELLLDHVPGAREAILKKLGIEAPVAEEDAVDPDDFDSVAQYVVKQKDFLKDAPKRLDGLQQSFQQAELANTLVRVQHQVALEGVATMLGISVPAPTPEQYNQMSVLVRGGKDIETAYREVCGKPFMDSLKPAKNAPRTLRQQTAANADRPRAFKSDEEELLYNLRRARR